MTASEYVPGSALARELLSSFRFAPDAGGLLTVDDILANTKASPEDIEAVLREFEIAGLIVDRSQSGVKSGPYAPERKAWEVRERLLTADGKRHPALAEQLEYELSDLLLALLAAPDIWNGRITGAFFGRNRAVRLSELEAYLYAYPPKSVETEVNSLVLLGLVQPEFQGHQKGDEAFAITGRGVRKYKDEVSSRLHVDADQSILDEIDVTTNSTVDNRNQISLFEAWQSECPASRDVISAALREIVQELNSEDRVAYPLTIVRATAPGDGAIRIDVALQERIRNADFFVGDLTPVYAYGDRLRVNENVLVEVGFALASKDPNRIVLLAKKDVKVPGDASNAKPAFDIAHVRRIQFKNKDGLKRSLRTELEALLRAASWLPEDSVL